MQLVYAATWEKLPREYHQIIRECARESAVYERKLWEERIHESEERVRKAGCQVVELAAKEKGRFREAMLSIYGEYCGEYMDMIQEILEAGSEQ